MWRKPNNSQHLEKHIHLFNGPLSGTTQKHVQKHVTDKKWVDNTWGETTIIMQQNNIWDMLKNSNDTSLWCTLQRTTKHTIENMSAPSEAYTILRIWNQHHNLQCGQYNTELFCSYCTRPSVLANSLSFKVENIVSSKVLLTTCSWRIRIWATILEILP